MYLGFRVDYTFMYLTLCLFVTLYSSSIIYVLSSSEMRHLPARSVSRPHCISPGQSLGRVARDAENVSFYNAFSRVQSLDHANPLQKTSEHAQVVILPRVQSPGQSIVKIEHHASHHASRFENVSFYLAFLTLTIESLERVARKMCHFTTRSVAFNRSTRPIHCKNQGAERFDKMCNFTSRSSHANPL